MNLIIDTFINKDIINELDILRYFDEHFLIKFGFVNNQEFIKLKI